MSIFYFRYSHKIINLFKLPFRMAIIVLTFLFVIKMYKLWVAHLNLTNLKFKYQYFVDMSLICVVKLSIFILFWISLWISVLVLVILNTQVRLAFLIPYSFQINFMILLRFHKQCFFIIKTLKVLLKSTY